LDSGTDKNRALADVAVIVCAARDTNFPAVVASGGIDSCWLIAMKNLSLAHHPPIIGPTNTECFAARSEWTPNGTTMCGNHHGQSPQTGNQSLAFERAHTVLRRLQFHAKNQTRSGISAECADEEVLRSPETQLRPSLATITASKRAAFLSDSQRLPNPCRATLLEHLLAALSEWQQTGGKNPCSGSAKV